MLELVPDTNLRLARRVAGAIRRQDQERARGRLVARGLGEVRAVGQGEHIRRDFERTAALRVEHVTEADVRLEVTRSARAAALRCVVLESIAIVAGSGVI